ncbi:17.1 kDa class II heat shock protein-like [Typha angustifolia]|uniref:17.1 kDa class II heat shock protein-like n=1 Tax=Typha angustifolia TaxID=59011 RepID=UPI003C30CC3F
MGLYLNHSNAASSFHEKSLRNSSKDLPFKLNRDPLGRKRAMDYRMTGLDFPFLSTLQHLMDVPDEMEKAFNAPTRTYVRDARAMASTPADVKELPSSYVFVVDMPGLKSGEIKVQVEDDRVLVVSGERKREAEEKEGSKYLRMERRMGKFMRRFSLPENANLEAISAVCQDGVLTVTVEKLPPPEPKKPKTIEVKIA